MSYEASSQTGNRTTTYGYGLDDIQRAREGLGRQSALGSFKIGKKFQGISRSLGGGFNRRGMVDSGLHQRGREKTAADKEMAQFGLTSQVEEANRQLDRQRQQIEEQYYGGIMSDDISNALRRFALAQTLQGMS